MNIAQLKELDRVGFETLEVISNANQFNKWMYDAISPFMKGNILELGSGIGNITDFIVLDFDHITLSDYNSSYCSYLNVKYAGNDNIKAIIQINLQDQYFKEKYALYKNNFDTIILLNVLEHLEKDTLAIEYCNFLLKKNGHLIILVPAYQSLYAPLDRALGHYKRYSATALTSLFKKNRFEILHKNYFNLLGFFGWVIFNKILRRKKLKNNEMSYFNNLVPFAKWMDKITLNKIGLSVITIGRKK